MEGDATRPEFATSGALGAGNPSDAGIAGKTRADADTPTTSAMPDWPNAAHVLDSLEAFVSSRTPRGGDGAAQPETRSETPSGPLPAIDLGAEPATDPAPSLERDTTDTAATVASAAIPVPIDDAITPTPAGEQAPRGVRLSRRNLLRVAAGAGSATAALPLAGSLAHMLGIPSASAAAAVSSSTALHRWVLVFDLRDCDGCGHCTEACQQGHYLDEQQQWIKVYQLQDASGQPYYMPRPCMQCEDAPCLRVCPTGATFADQDGIILVDQARCIGCRMCMAACPYEARYFNWSDPSVLPPPGTTPTPEFPAPQIKGTVGKCVFCVQDTVRGGLPYCVSGCPMAAVWIGDLDADVATNGQEAVRLSSFLTDNDAVRFKEELNTKPRVWYIPGHGQDLSY